MIFLKLYRPIWAQISTSEETEAPSYILNTELEGDAGKSGCDAVVFGTTLLERNSAASTNPSNANAAMANMAAIVFQLK